MRSMASRRMGCGDGLWKRTALRPILRDAASAAPQDEVGVRARSNQSAQDLRGLPAKLGVADVEGAGALVFRLAVKKCCTTMPAGPCRDRERLAATVATRLIAREINHVGFGCYDFLNHCCPRGLRQRYCRKTSRKGSVQRSNFTGAIELDDAMHGIQFRMHFLNLSAQARRG